MKTTVTWIFFFLIFYLSMWLSSKIFASNFDYIDTTSFSIVMSGIMAVFFSKIKKNFTRKS